MSSESQGKTDDLQFDRVETKPGQSSTERLGPAVTCTVCKRSIGTEYWQANGKPVCGACRQRLQMEATSGKGAGKLIRAGVFGLGAAIAGAAIYYAVMAIADLEIGIVAILIGYMVGYSVRKGAAGRGGKRFQIIAAVLTYWAVGLAYTPFALKGLVEGKSAKVTATTPADSSGTAPTATRDSASAAATDSASAPVTDTTATKAAASKSAEPVSTKTFLAAIGIMLLLVFALPVTAIVGTMPSGLISALIIFFGLRQAWRMTAVPELNITGPYKVGMGGGPAGATG